MTRLNFRSYLMMAAGVICFFAVSCLKANDPPPAKPNPNLKNHYCNDPRAINYNWGFPGIPDNTVCIYPVDSFLGQWSLTDSVFHADSSFDYLLTGTLNFTATEDSSKTHLKVLGFCNNSSPLFATADKYGYAGIDSMNNETAGQLLCSASDTVTGSFQFLMNTKDTLRIQLNITGANAGYHKGIAHKL